MVVLVSLAVIGFSLGWWGQQAFSPTGGKAEEMTSSPADSRPVVGSAPAAVEAAGDETVGGNTIGALLDEAESRGERVLPARTVVSRFSGRAISEGSVSDEVAELLQLTEAERAAADRAIAAASERLQQLELARLELALASDTEVVFRVGAFVEEGEAVRTAYREELLRGLDPEAGELFWQLTVKEARYYGHWKGWGDEAKELRFAIEPNESDPGRFWVSFGAAQAGAFTASDGRPEHTSRTMTNHRPENTWSTYEAVAGRHQYLTHHLPEPLRSLFHPGSTREARR